MALFGGPFGGPFWSAFQWAHFVGLFGGPFRWPILCFRNSGDICKENIRCKLSIRINKPKNGKTEEGLDRLEYRDWCRS